MDIGFWHTQTFEQTSGWFEQVVMGLSVTSLHGNAEFQSQSLDLTDSTSSDSTVAVDFEFYEEGEKPEEISWELHEVSSNTMLYSQDGVVSTRLMLQPGTAYLLKLKDSGGDG